MSPWRIAGALVLMVAAGCGYGDERRAAVAADLTGGDPAAGRALVNGFGCGTCHTIPGVPGANGLIGPPLGGVGERMILAGRIPNSPRNMMLWIQNPQQVDSLTAMPNLGVTEEQSRHIVAFLYSRR